MLTAADHIGAFMDAMHAAGVEPDEPIANKLASGEFVRFKCKDERKANGWAKLFLDERPAGRFGNHRLAIDQTWKANSAPVKRSPEERKAWLAKMAQQATERSAAKLTEETEAAAYAVRYLARSAPAVSHPYLAKKRISGENMRIRRDRLLVPMTDADGAIWNVQRIFPDGAKRFLTGARVEGLFWMVGPSIGPLCIGEGIGTVAAIRRATGYAVTASFSAGNLEAVARIMRTMWPDRDLIVCADDDTHLIHNPRIRRNLGVDAAKAAAAAIGARFALPPRSNTNV